MPLGPMVYSKCQIGIMLEEIARKIQQDLRHCRRRPVFTIVLYGGVPFAPDLLRLMQHPENIEVLYIHAASYGEGTESSGHVKLHYNLPDHLRRDPDNWRLLHLDEIMDTGGTAHRIIEEFESLGFLDQRFAVLFDKRVKRRHSVEANYAGAIVPDRFFVGYGMGLGDRFRMLPDVHTYLPDEP
ncbi:MAG: phosphoribosyltransferase family protein [Patescibacteria group bacterium]|jgi:hypoxanthine phosphoribosyltransferase